MRPVIALFLALPALCATPALTQDAETAFSPKLTEACLGALGDGVDPQICVGKSAGVCMLAPNGDTTFGMVECLVQEADYWDARLNAAYTEVMAGAKAADDEAASYGMAFDPQADALRDMQRAWIAYRDAACLYERSTWGGGTGGGPAAASCLMSLTAAQALRLEGRSGEGG